LELRRRLDGISSSSPQWADHQRTQTSRSGWTRFDFEKSLGKPIRIINDAAMQPSAVSTAGACFSRTRHRTGIDIDWETNVLPLELGDLPYGNGDIIEDYLGKSGMKQLGEKKWKREVLRASCC